MYEWQKREFLAILILVAEAYVWLPLPACHRQLLSTTLIR